MKLSQSECPSFTFVLVPNFTLLAYSCAIEALRISNSVAGEKAFHWLTTTYDGAPIRCSNGLSVVPDCGVSVAPKADFLVICGGHDIERHYDDRLDGWLRQQARKGSTIVTLCTGAYALAKAGILRDHTCTVHWDHGDMMKERFPELHLTDHIFDMDRGIITCSGGAAPLDLLLTMIKGMKGEPFARNVAEIMIYEPLREQDERQRFSVSARADMRHPQLSAALRLMEEFVEEPLSVAEIAERVDLSRRQIERLFRQHTGRSPRDYYVQIRLRRAKHLILKTDMRMIDVAVASGFRSDVTLRRAFKRNFHEAPSGMRA